MSLLRVELYNVGMGFQEEGETRGFGTFLQEWQSKANLIGKTGHNHRNGLFSTFGNQGTINASDTIF